MDVDGFDLRGEGVVGANRVCEGVLFSKLDLTDDGGGEE